jgi:acylphosphatase
MAKHLRISGLVQGVGYRASFEARARRLGLSGWVRNCLDGSVEALVRGEAEALDDIIDWARHGPPAARVDRLAATDAEDGLIPDTGFRIMPTQ